VQNTKSKDLIEDRDQVEELAVAHCFERVSVMKPLALAAAVLRYGIGYSTPDDALEFVACDNRRISRTGALITTPSVQEEEAELISILQAGQGAHEKIGRDHLYPTDDPAILHILASRDLVTSIQGPAGSGKTRMMKDAIEAIKRTYGSSVVVLAPSSSSVQVLCDNGFDAMTFEAFARSEIMQQGAMDQVVWIDEAGFLSVKQLLWIVRYCALTNVRLILSGDTKQHHGVERGDALRVLEDTGAIRSYRLDEIKRQQVEELRLAIEELSKGESAAGFTRLDLAGVISEEIDSMSRKSKLVQRHLAALAMGRSSLIVAPTHNECRALSTAVRAELRKLELIGQKDYATARLQNRNLTEAQKRDPASYQAGDIIVFHARVRGGFRANEIWQVNRIESDGTVIVCGTRENKKLPLKASKRFGVYRLEGLPVAKGDTLRVTKNFKGVTGKFINGDLLKVNSVDSFFIHTDKGAIDYQVPVHLDQGHAVTSHASQGKTVDQVLVSAPVETFAQVNQAQFYVSMSRAKLEMYLFTDSKEALRQAIERPSERLSPSEII
jgi:ATP-dependent exoDNAse (exonuclease V) alpha subunit